jgi:hypothetical protein
MHVVEFAFMMVAMGGFYYNPAPHDAVIKPVQFFGLFLDVGPYRVSQLQVAGSNL